MTSVAEPYPQPNVPETKSGSRKKKALALLLLLGIAASTFLAVRYLQTGKPISKIAGPMVPAPVQSLLQSDPVYVDSRWDITRPLGVAAGPNGTMYVTESAGDRLIRGFDAKGAQFAAFAPAGTDNLNRLPTYVAVSPAGLVYVSDQMLRSVNIYSATGEPVGQVAAPSAEGWGPTALAFDRAGNLYVADVFGAAHRVLVYDAQGALQLSFGKAGTGPGEFSFPNGIAADSKGNIYVADSGNGRVQAFDRTGTLLWAIGRGTGKGDLALPRGIAVDDAHNLLYVVDTTDQSVKVYDISGVSPKLALTMGGQGAAADSLRFPNSVALATGERTIYIADRENNRVAIFK